MSTPVLAFKIIKTPRREPEIPERIVQVFLSQNLVLLGLGALQLVEIEHPLQNIGRVDILAKGFDGTLHAIEVKRAIATREAIGQLQSYVGSLMTAYPSQKVRGVLVAAGLDGPARAALVATPTINFWSYSAVFKFENVPIARPTSQLAAPRPPRPSPPPVHSNCPFCRQDALARWKDDGRTYCRKCGNFLN